MAPFVFRCPATGLNVQHELDDGPDVSENEYVAITCLACTRLHLVNRTGKVLGMEPKIIPPTPLPTKPLCIKCGGKMRFSCIEEEKPGFVHHVYECTKCRSTQSFVTPV